MSREAFEAWWESERRRTWNLCGYDKDRSPEPNPHWLAAFKPRASQAWQAAQADAFERAAERAREFLTHGRSPLGLSVSEAIRALAKETT